MNLTPKQRKFAENIISGMNPSQAYRKAGYTFNGTNKALAVEAQRLLHHPFIAKIISEGKACAMNKAVWTRQTAIERLKRINDKLFNAITSGEADKDTLKAFIDTTEALNKLADVSYEIELRRKVLDIRVLGDMGTEILNPGLPTSVQGLQESIYLLDCGEDG